METKLIKWHGMEIYVHHYEIVDGIVEFEFSDTTITIPLVEIENQMEL